MRALSIRQPYVEQILRGEKTIEYRSRPTAIVGERFYLYAARTPGPAAGFAALGCEPGALPTGLLVGTAIVTHVTLEEGMYHWHLSGVKRLKRPRRPTGHPQPVWFAPFGRRGNDNIRRPETARNLARAA